MPFYIHSKALKLVEPLFVNYYDFHLTMLAQEIQLCIENSGVTFMKVKDGVVEIDYLQAFYENERLTFRAPKYPYNEIPDEETQYFNFESSDKDEEALLEDYKVYIGLTYMGYIYYKEKNNLFYSL